MATARKKKASKKTSKKAARRHTGSKITPIAKPDRRRKSQAYWSKWSAAQPTRTDVEGRPMFVGPLARPHNRALRKAMRAMGMSYDEPTAEFYRGQAGELILQSPKVRARRKPSKKPAKKAAKKKTAPRSASTKKKVSRRGVSADAIIKAAKKTAKLSRIGKLLKTKGMPPVRSAAWACGNPRGQRTGCGGGKKKLGGSRVIGIFQ